MILSLAGLMLLGFTAAVLAQAESGGCHATINGVSPPSMTRNNPLLVSKGQQVLVQGSVPASVQQSFPENGVTSNTTISVSII